MEQPDAAEQGKAPGRGMLHMYHQLWYAQVADYKLPPTAAPALDIHEEDELVPDDEGRCALQFSIELHAPCLAPVDVASTDLISYVSLPKQMF